jgi:hypothetical protein
MAHSNLSAEQFQSWQTYSKSPNYIDFVTSIWRTMKWYYAPQMWDGYVFPHSFIDEFNRNYNFPLHEVSYIIYIAIFITVIRFVFERVICKVCSLR